MKSKNLIFSVVAGSIFYFRLNILTSKILNLGFKDSKLPLGAEEADGRESWYTQPIVYPMNIYLWCFFNDLFVYFIVVLQFFGASEDLIRDS